MNGSKIVDTDKFVSFCKYLLENEIRVNGIHYQNSDYSFTYFIDSPTENKQKQTTIDRENTISIIHEQVMNVLKSYGGNWVMNAFNSQRQEEVLNYLYHRYKTISTSDLKKAFESILDELSNIDLKPFGE